MTSSAAPPCQGHFKTPTSDKVEAATLAPNAEALAPCSACKIKSTSSSFTVSSSGISSNSIYKKLPA